VEGAAPPTIAAAGNDSSSASDALMTNGILIGSGIARLAENAKQDAKGNAREHQAAAWAGIG
jgi:hypothetical protein